MAPNAVMGVLAMVVCCLQLGMGIKAMIVMPSGNGGNGSSTGIAVVTSTEQTPMVAKSTPDDRMQLERCREACLKKHATKESLCAQRRDCSLCQSKCSSSSLHAGSTLTLVLLQMIRNDSLVTADVAWVSIGTNPTSALKPRPQQQQHQCLVTWEVSGGGLMGNLLTESSSVQLSLWPETNYSVQVTCRNKNTDSLIRSAPILLDTSVATVIMSSSSTASPEPAPEPKTPPLELEIIPKAGNPRQAPKSPTTAMWPITRQSQQEIILLGVFVAALTFLLILLTVVIFVKRKRLSAGGGGGGGWIGETDKDVLVEGDSSGDEGTMVEILHV